MARPKKDVEADGGDDGKSHVGIDDDLVEMTLDGETIKVHALSVDDHKRLGWKTTE